VEIKQLEVAVEAFKLRYGVYPPSRLKLCEISTYYDVNNQLDMDSVALLQTMFPRIDVRQWTDDGIDWNGNGQIDKPSGKVIPGTDFDGAWTLEGDQVLVFCLGGIPVPSKAPQSGAAGDAASTRGFSRDPKNPANPNGAGNLGELYEFDSNRLVRIARTYNPTNTFYSYLDKYGTSDGWGNYLSGSPYLYFSSYKKSNGYNRYLGLEQPAYLTAENGLPFSFSDCYTASHLYATSSSGRSAYATSYQSRYPLSPTGSWPYAESGPPKDAGIVFLKANSFQIISAGADTFFGPGTVPTNPQFWTPETAPTMNPPGSPGHDDLSNFAGAKLGVGLEK
jgi:hypothetical protein